MSKKLLLADDSVVIQKLVGLSFANEDVEIVSTDNGDDAVTLAREIQPDVILADVVMPGKSGYEVCEAIKQDPALSGIPVLLLTGTFEAFDEGRAASAGANGQITKPFEAQALVERVTEVMNAPPVPATPSVAEPAIDVTPTVDADNFSMDADETIVAGVSSGDSTTGSEDFFDDNVSSLSEAPAGIEDDVLGGSDLDRTPGFPAMPMDDSNETTSSGLFGAPGDGAQDTFDTEGGTLAIGQSVANGSQPESEETVVDFPELPAARSREEATSQPVDLSTALENVTSDPESTLLVATDDINAETSPGYASIPPIPQSPPPVPGDSPTNSGEDASESLIVHTPSQDIDQAAAMAPSPPAWSENDDLSTELPPASGADATVVADLDADLDTNLDASLDLGFEPPQTGSDSLDLGPASLEGDDLDFAFDVSEQVEIDDLGESNDRMDDSFSSLMDISEASILGGADPVAQATPAEPPAAPTSSETPGIQSNDEIGVGYDVSSSDLATADGQTSPGGAPNQSSPSSSPSIEPITPPEPEPLIEVPELPEARPRSTVEATPVTGSSDLFDGLNTGSALENMDASGAVDEFSSGFTPSENSDGPPLNVAEDLTEVVAAPADPTIGDRSPDFAPVGIGADVSESELAPEAGISFGASTDLEVEDPIVEEANYATDSAPADAEFDANESIIMGSHQDRDAASERAIPDLSPMMEQQIQETLEKVAWEAFSDLSESIVKQVMNRVEQIAWEVIPEMAETLVREEIRKMKGEDD